MRPSAPAATRTWRSSASTRSRPSPRAEGGIVTTRDPRAARAPAPLPQARDRPRPRLLASRRQGGWYYEQQELGFNYRLTDVHSALGRSQLGKLDRFIERRNAIAARYREWLADIEQLELPPAAPDGSTHAYHLFVVRHREGADARRRLYDGLREREILAQVHYIPVHLHPYYRERYGYGPGLCPEAERYYSGCLSLPCFPALTEADQSRVVDAVRELVSMSRPEFAIGGRPVGPEPPDLRDRRGRRQPQPRPRDSARRLIDVAAGRGRRRRQVPDLLGEPDLLIEDAEVQVPRGHQRQAPGRAARGDRAAARVAGRASPTTPAARGIHFFSTPFDHEAVAELDALDVPVLKIASFEIVDLPLIRRRRQTGRPLLISTGMATLGEVEEALAAARGAGATESA